MNKKKKVIYMCENGHPQEVSTTGWGKLNDNGDLVLGGPPKRIFCWKLWKDNICGKDAIPLDRV